MRSTCVVVLSSDTRNAEWRVGQAVTLRRTPGEEDDSLVYLQRDLWKPKVVLDHTWELLV